MRVARERVVATGLGELAREPRDHATARRRSARTTPATPRDPDRRSAAMSTANEKPKPPARPSIAVEKARAPSGASSTAAIAATVNVEFTNARVRICSAGQRREARARTRTRDCVTHTPMTQMRIMRRRPTRSDSAVATSDTSTPARETASAPPRRASDAWKVSAMKLGVLAEEAAAEPRDRGRERRGRQATRPAPGRSRRRGGPPRPFGGCGGSRPSRCGLARVATACFTLRRSTVATSGPMAHQKNGTTKSVLASTVSVAPAAVGCDRDLEVARSSRRCRAVR